MTERVTWHASIVLGNGKCHFINSARGTGIPPIFLNPALDDGE